MPHEEQVITMASDPNLPAEPPLEQDDVDMDDEEMQLALMMSMQQVGRLGTRGRPLRFSSCVDL